MRSGCKQRLAKRTAAPHDGVGWVWRGHRRLMDGTIDYDPKFIFDHNFYHDSVILFISYLWKKCFQVLDKYRLFLSRRKCVKIILLLHSKVANHSFIFVMHHACLFNYFLWTNLITYKLLLLSQCPSRVYWFILSENFPDG